MKTFDFEEFCRRLNLVMIIYDKKLAPEVLTIYFDALKNFELSQIVVALAQYTQDAEKGMFAPKPADIFRLIGGTQTDQANVAWGKLYRAISEIGAYQDVIFDDACIHAAVRDLGGWTHICESDYDQISFIQNKFIKIYTAYKNQVIARLIPIMCAKGYKFHRLNILGTNDVREKSKRSRLKTWVFFRQCRNSQTKQPKIYFFKNLAFKPCLFVNLYHPMVLYRKRLKTTLTLA